MAEITDKLRKWRVSAEWLQSKAGWLVKGASLLIDCPYRETASYAKQQPPELYTEYLCVVSAWRHKSVAAFCQNVEDYKLGNKHQTNSRLWWTTWCVKSVKWEQQPLSFLAQHHDSLKQSCRLWAAVQCGTDVYQVWIDGWERICQELFDRGCLSSENVFTAFTDLIGYPVANFPLQRQTEHCLLLSP